MGRDAGTAGDYARVRCAGAGKLADYVGVASFEIDFCFDPGDDRRCTVDVKSTGNYDA
jgi:hypothetical protein